MHHRVPSVLCLVCVCVWWGEVFWKGAMHSRNRGNELELSQCESLQQVPKETPSSKASPTRTHSAFPSDALTSRSASGQGFLNQPLIGWFILLARLQLITFTVSENFLQSKLLATVLYPVSSATSWKASHTLTLAFLTANSASFLCYLAKCLAPFFMVILSVTMRQTCIRAPHL